MRVERLEQVGLAVADVAETARFYNQVLGLLVSNFEPGQTTLHCDGQRLVIQPLDLAETDSPPPAVVPITLSFGTHARMAIVTGHLAARGIPLLAGPMRRADGRQSVFVRDPDGNRVEIISLMADS